MAIVDQDASAFRRLPADFSGLTVKGIGFDRETLENAGIIRAGAFAAVSSGDNTNILAARVARETYGVKRVVARIYDPRRAEIYERLGIPTVATVAWTSSQIMRRLLPLGSDELFRDPSGYLAVGEIAYGEMWIGKRASDLEQAAGVRITYISRYGEPSIPTIDTVIQEGDNIYASYRTDEVANVVRIFAHGPREA
ncbi:unannotated protein [freshwater metagenome]|uniref:Unannotated protein n=1 Tax=freshwater metagenome TaxID=449393 RepID=A0A6J7SJ01_9ZZZZ